MRVYLLWLLVAFLSIYAWRDWFRSVCGLVLLMAVIQHPDMPKNIMGIQGLNPWNVLMANILVAWLVSRRRDGIVWDMPRYVNVLLVLYLGVVLFGFVRMMFDRAGLDNPSPMNLISEYLINTVKWVTCGLLIFEGCRDRGRLKLAMVCILGVYILLALQVIRWMPAASVFGGADILRTRTRLLGEVGHHAVSLSMMLAGGSWAIVSMLPLMRRRWQQALTLATALMVTYGQALTGGRAGYATWGGVGLLLCLFRWRKYLLLAPIVLIVLTVALPGAADRMLQGFGVTNDVGIETRDEYEITSGRNLIWPYVIDQIMESPAVGSGREAMVRTGLRGRLQIELNEYFGHPHNAYLQFLLDNGIIGFLLVMPFYVVVVVQSARLFMERRDPWCAAVGGMALALVTGLLLAGMGSESFYPREDAVAMWAAIGVMFRVSLERDQALALAHSGGAQFEAAPRSLSAVHCQT